MKKLALLLVAALVVTLVTVSCSKKKEEKPFSMSETVKLMSNTAQFSGTLTNPEELSDLYLLLKQDDKADYEKYQISYSNNSFAFSVNDLENSSFKYYYEYVLNGSTKSTSKKSFSTNYPILLVGRWKTEDEGYYEEYMADGTAKYWVPEDDIPEEDAKPFTWYIDKDNKLTQLHPMDVGSGVIPQYCNILILNDTIFNYDNNAARAEYMLYREIE